MLYNSNFLFFWNYFINCSEKGELKAAAAKKVRQLMVELAGTAETTQKPISDPVEKILTGFKHFKKEKYE